MKMRLLKVMLLISLLFCLTSVFAGQWQMNEVPYANPIGFEIEWDDEDLVEYEMYITDFFQQEYQTFEGTDPYTYTLFWKINDGQFNQIPNLKAGDHKIKVGKLPVGFYHITFYVKDNLGRQSAIITKEFRVIDKQNRYKTEKVYTMLETDLKKYNIDNQYTKGDPKETYNGLTNLHGLQKLLDEKKAEGYDKVVLYPGTYMLETVRDTGEKETVFDENVNKYYTFPKYDISKPLFMPDRFTLDLNGATLKQVPHGAAGGVIVIMQEVYDSHLINGTLEGDFFEHKYENIHSSEWANCLAISTGTKYCSAENVVVKDVTGYASTIGWETKFYREGQTKAPDYTYYYPVGGVGEKMVQYGDPKNNRIISENYIDLTKVVNANCDFIQIGKYLGYQGNAVGDANWTYIAHFYDDAKQELAAFPAYFYRRVKFPKGSKYFRLELMRTDDNTVKNYPDIKMFSFKYPVNCKFENLKFNNCRVLGCAPAATESFVLKNSTFNDCGRNVTKCAFDAEDGWDMMHDMWLCGNTFTNNPYNDILMAGGHCTTIEKNNSRVYTWPRSKSTTIRDNDSYYLSSDSTGVSRMYRNRSVRTRINNKGQKEYYGEIKSNNQMLRDNITCEIVAPRATNMTVVSGNISSCKDIRNSTFLETGFNGYMNEGTMTNCTFMLLDEYKQQLIAEKKPLEYRLSLNQDDERPGRPLQKVIFNNCTFKDMTDVANHNRNIRTYFNDCTFEDVRIHTGSTEGHNEVVFNNCKIKSTAEEFLKVGSFAYNMYNPSITFKNSTIEHSGNTLINIFAHPLKTSNINFENCIIRKETGSLLYRRIPMTETKYLLDINFKDCDYSPYIEANINNNSPDCIKVNFVNRKNKDALIAKINAAKEKDLSIYTDASKQLVLDKIKEAEVVRDNPSANELMITNAIKGLDDAILKLSVKVNKNDLIMQRDFIRKTLKDDYTNYTNVTANRLKLAMQEADRIILDANVEQSVVDAAYCELQAAYEALETDKTLLKQKVEEIKAENLVYTEYTDATANLLKIELENAEKILSTKIVNKVDIDNAYKNLTAARNSLTPISYKNKLQEKVDAINGEFNGVYTGFKVATVDNLKAMLAEAEKVLLSPTANTVTYTTAYNNLVNAYNNLETDVDKTLLRKKIDEVVAENLVETTYTPFTWYKLSLALEGGERMYANKRATASDVTSAINAITYARENLAIKPNKDELTTLTNKYNKELENHYGEYTKPSGQRMGEALNYAKKIVRNDNATQEEVTNALTELKAAYENLVTIADRTPLRNKVTEINNENLVYENYTKDTADRLKNALARANTVLENKRATEADIQGALTELTAAREGLKLSSNKDSLIARYNEINLEFNGVYTDFTQVTAEALKVAMQEADKVIKDNTAIQSVINSTLIKLNTAYNNLETNVDKTELKNKVAEINNENLNSNLFITATWTDLQAALTNAKNIIAKKRATKIEVTDALNNLTLARNNLTTNANRKPLQDKVNEINREFNGNYSAFTTVTKTEIENAMKHAEDVLVNKMSMEKDITDAFNRLSNAYNNLETNVNKIPLREKVNSINAENINYTMYTTATGNALKAALQKAETVLNNKRATEQMVTEALNTLTDARTKLVKLGDKTNLRTKYDSIKLELKEDYSIFTPSTGNAIKLAMDNAKNVLLNTEATEADVTTALANLEKAYAALETNVNKAELKAKVDAITNENLNKQDFKLGTWTAFESALIDARNVLENKRATQQLVNNTLNNLNEKYSLLETNVDKTNLINKLAEIKNENLVQANYTSATWAELQNAITKANEIVNKKRASELEVMNALNLLTEARNKLTLKADKTLLRNKVAEINKEFNGNYSEFTVVTANALKVAMQEAERLLADAEPTEVALSKALENINIAYVNLESNVDKNALKAKIAEINNENLIANQFVSTTWQALQTALTKANEVIAKKRLTQNEVTATLNNLVNARTNLVRVGDKKNLQDKVNAIKQEFGGIYTQFTQATADALKIAMAEASDVLKNVDATEEIITKALNKLNAAYDALETNVDKTNLKNKVTEINNENLVQDKYSVDTWNALQTALTNANNTIANKRATEVEVTNALNNLVTARKNLTVKANKTDLLAKIEEVEKDFKGDYSSLTAQSANTLKEALAEAKRVYADNKAEQKIVNSALASLTAAYNNCESNIDKTALRNKVDEIKKLDLTGFTEESVQNLNNALATANDILNKKRVTKIEVDNAVTNLTKAQNELKEKINTALLKEKVDAINKEFGGNYSSLSATTANNLKAAMEEANRVLTNPNASQIDVNNALTKLNAAYDAIETNVDKTNLINKVNEITKENIDYTKYTDVTANALKDALAKAKDIINKKRVTEKEVTDALTNLTNAYNNLELKVNKNALNTEITSVASIDLSLYTKESVDNLNKVLAEAKKVADNPKATQAQIDKAEKDLVQAKKDLKLKEADKKSLEAKIKEAEGIDKTKYTDVTVELLNESINKAKTILAKQNPGVLEVENAIKDLDAKIKALELKKVNKDTLKVIIDKAEKIDYSLYTEDTVKALHLELEKANAVYNNKEATEKMVKDAENNLNLAISKLTLKPATTVPNKPNPQVPQTSPSRPGNDNGNEIVNTGDEFIIIAVAVLVITILLNIIYFSVSKKKRK